MAINEYSLLFSTKACDSSSVKKYRSLNSGLTVIVANVEGPMVSGFFTLATEAHDDDGLPHTLEHLIFLGSKRYPFKGVLDLLANRNLASGTNAWTDTDHTCYTITTAGSEGFLNLMPIYLDHILYPTLTDAGYITEVHHIDGSGQDAGVVYCEEQGTENTGESLVFLQMLREAYPGHCGYKSQTGGILKNLRESTSNSKVRDFHKQFYRPENLTLIIVGHIKDEDVLRVLSEYEEKSIVSDPTPFIRPWQAGVPPLTKSVDKLVLYPSDDEDNGMIYVAWRGPSAVTQLSELSACTILLRYLTDTAISPLQKEFVEVADPVASSVNYSIQENSISLLYIAFENVPFAKLSEVKPRLDAKLREISSGIEKFDVARIRTIIHRQRLETLLNIETQPHNTISFMLIGDVLYGNNEEQFHRRLNPIEDLDRMELEEERFWIGLLDKYLLKSPSVTIRGQPSQAEMNKLAQDEEMRIGEQVEKLGPDGLKQKASELEAAIEFNNLPPPSEMLVSTPLPDPARVVFHNVTTYSSDDAENLKQCDILDLPFYAHIDDINSKFVYLMVLMDTSSISNNLRPYLPFFLEAILQAAIMRNGVLIDHETVVAELERYTIAASTSLGIACDSRFGCGPFGQTAVLTIQVEPSHYERGILFLHELLFRTEFQRDRLSIVAAKTINEVAEFRRKSSKISWDIMWSILFDKESNLNTNNMIRQQKFLSEVGKSLMDENDKSVFANMEAVRRALTAPGNFSIRLSANLNLLTSHCTDIVAPWKSLSPHAKNVRQKLKVIPDSALLKPSGSQGNAWVLGLGSNESNYLCQTVPCITDRTHADLPALMVFLQYLTQLEGPMWKQIRGIGLSYGYSIRPRTNEGLLHLSFYRSTKVTSAYTEAKNIVESHLKGEIAFDSSLLDAAKYSMIFEIIQKEDTVSNCLRQNILSYFYNTSSSYNRELVKKIAGVTTVDLLAAGRNYVAPLFDTSRSTMTLVCHSSKVSELINSFTQMGFTVNDCKSLNNHFLGC